MIIWTRLYHSWLMDEHTLKIFTEQSDSIVSLSEKLSNRFKVKILLITNSNLDPKWISKLESTWLESIFVNEARWEHRIKLASRLINWSQGKWISNADMLNSLNSLNSKEWYILWVQILQILRKFRW